MVKEQIITHIENRIKSNKEWLPLLTDEGKKLTHARIKELESLLYHIKL